MTAGGSVILNTATSSTQRRPFASVYLLRASPCGQQTAKPPRPRKSRDGGSTPGPARHFWEVISAGVWPGLCPLSPDRINAIALFRPAGLPIVASMTMIPLKNSLS